MEGSADDIAVSRDGEDVMIIEKGIVKHLRYENEEYYWKEFSYQIEDAYKMTFDFRGKPWLINLYGEIYSFTES